MGPNVLSYCHHAPSRWSIHKKLKISPWRWWSAWHLSQRREHQYYTDISKRTFRRWLKESKESAQAEDPSTRQRPKKLDSFDVDLILRTMTDMMDRREVVTLKRLHAQLSQKDLEVKRTTLCNILKAKGFVYARSQGNRKVLCERPDLQAARCSYLRKIYDVRNNTKMDVVYLDES